MAWNKLLPTGATKIKDSDDAIRANWTAIEAVIGSIADPTKFSIDADGNVDMHSNSINNLLGIGATPISAAQWGYVGALTTDPIGGDGTAGRILRYIEMYIRDGIGDNTLKCQVVNQWNGNVIAETDNIIKDAITGHFNLTADGKILSILSTGLTGNAVFSSGFISYNASGSVWHSYITDNLNNININLKHPTTGVNQDITVVADGGSIYLRICYITDA